MVTSNASTIVAIYRLPVLLLSAWNEEADTDKGGRARIGKYGGIKVKRERRRRLRKQQGCSMVAGGNLKKQCGVQRQQQVNGVDYKKGASLRRNLTPHLTVHHKKGRRIDEGHLFAG
ncbi:hypothetical protein [uncultured Mailhella sp.]|uniref:hypothetical protein n=1 Tax=uncultured Mailhella sp. TaxID=1981031 RepID=UPI003208C7A1